MKVLKVVGAVFALAVLLLAYNVLAHLVFWGSKEPVSISSAGVSVECTFAKPADEGVFPAVIVLLGSGPETRNGPAYRINASNMLRHGFAILICDKRGAGESGGDFDSATFHDFAADAKASVAYLAGREDVDAARIGLLANSESGWFSAQIAAETGQVAFIINRVGPPLSWVDTVLWEVRNELLDAGMDEPDVDTLLAANERRWRFYIAAADDPSIANGPELDSINAELKHLRETIPNADENLPEQAQEDAEFFRSFAADAAYDPVEHLRRIDVPLLYVFGGRDVNIPTQRSVEFLEAFRSEYAGTIDVRVYPDLGHPMATWRGILHGGYPPDYLAFVGDWAQQQASY